MWLKKKGLRTRCPMNVYKFPFDKQLCSIVLGSWFQYNEWITFSTIPRQDPFSDEKSSLGNNWLQVENSWK